MAIAATSMSLLSCGGAESAEETPWADGNREERLALVESDGRDTANLTRLGEAVDDAPPPAVPLGVFPSIGTLCRAQMNAVVPMLENAESWRRQMGMTEPTRPSCKEVGEVVAKADVALQPPYLGLTAIEFETGGAIETRLVVRTEAGFRALPEAVLIQWHFDPGCPSILREGGLVEVRVVGESATLVLVDKAWRGAGEEYDETGKLVALWSQELLRVRACRVESGVMTCNKPQVFEERRVAYAPIEERPSRIVASTTYEVDEHGNITLEAPLDVEE